MTGRLDDGRRMDDGAGGEGAANGSVIWKEDTDGRLVIISDA
jgi:hypothetical protein